MNSWNGIPALVLVALFSSWSFGAVEFKEAEITTLKNLVEHDPGTGAAPAKVNEKIGEKSKVSTSAASMAELTFADSSITRMGSNTQFSFQSKERLVKLEKGTILVHTPPGNGGATVNCGGVTGAVSGTTFMASRDGVGNVMFVLLEGQGGLKVTVGGTSTVIRPGQAASVGADTVQNSSSSKSDAPGGGVQGESKAASPSGDDSSGGAGPAKSPAGPDSGSGPASAGESPAPAKPVEIKVFEVDVKRVVATTPLVTEFKAELPSMSKIEATIEVQQAKVQDGKLEKLEVEVVAVAKEDGDFLIGSPKLDPEEMKVVNSKETVAEKAGGNRLDVDTAAGGNSLDVDTAAGPGAGAGTPVAASPAPRAETPAPAPPVATPSPVNPGQIVVNPPTSTTVPKTAVAIKVNDATRPFGQPNPSTFGFSITAGQLLTGHSLISEFLTTAAVNSPVSGSPYSVNFSNPRIVDASGADVTARYDLTTTAGVLNVLKASPNLVLGPVGSLVFGQSADLVASALNGSPTLEVISGAASVVNGKLVANSGTGSVVVRASAPGDENFNAATVEQTITLAKAGQSVGFTLPSSLTFGEDANLSASAVAGDVSFEVVSGAGQIVDGKLVAISGTGSVVVRAVTAGNDNYLGAMAEQTITLAKAGQSIRFAVPASLTYDATTGLSAAALDSGTVSFSVVSGPAAIDADGRLKALSGTGNVVVRATAAGDLNYTGTFVDRTITLAKAGQSVNFTLPPSLTYDAATSLAALPTGAGSVTYELVNPADSSKVSISGGQLKALSGTGNVQVRAVTAGDGNYDGASAVQTITLAKAGQSVNFTLPTSLTYDASTSLAALPTGAGSVTYELVNPADSSKVSISGGQLKALSGTGNVQVRAVTAGDSNYDGASTVQTITLAKAGQSVNFTLPTSLTYEASTSLAALPTGAGSVTYELVNPADSSKVSISRGQLKALSGTGSVQVRALTAGDSNYDGASAVQTITLAKAGQVLSLSGLPQGTFGAEYAPGLSGVQVGTANFSVRETDGRVAISGGKITLGKLFGANSFTLDVSAAGNDNFLPGSTTRTINIQQNVAAVEAANPIRDLLGERTRSFFSWTSDAFAQGYELELGGGEKTPGGQTIRLTSSYYEADGNFATAKVRRLGASAVAPEENLTGFVSSNDMPAAEMVALDNYFYFNGKAAGVTDGPSDFFVNAAAERTLAPSDHGPSVNLGTTTQSYDLYTAKTWKAGATPLISADGGVEKKIFYGDRIDLTSSGAFWDDLSLWDGNTPPVVDSDQRWANFLSRLSDAPDAATLVWDDQGGIVSGAADIYLGSLREFSLVAGAGGIAMQGATLVGDQTSVDLTTSGDLEIKTAKIMGIDAPLAAPGENQKSGQLTLEAGGKVKLGAQTVAGNAPTQTEAKDQQVRLEAVETSAGAPSMAVIRTGDSMELRNVTIRNFDGSKLEKVIRNSDGTTTLHGRVLMSGSAVQDFKIKELVGAAVNADAKIQMMAMDMNGNLAGEMMVEGQLPVATELARKLDASITGLLGEKPVHAASVDLTAKTVNFNNATITAMNAITARANTVIVQNSFMTVVRSSGMINMYVREGSVNMGFGTMRDGYANFAGANTFQFGNVAFNISNQDQLNAAYGTRLFDTQNSAGAQAGAINVLKL